MATILGAIDGSPVADAAIRKAVAFVGLDHEWELVSVVSPHGPTENPLVRLDPPVLSAEQIDRARLAAQRHALDLAAALGLSGDVRIETGEPGPTICLVAGALPADLIVVGSHGRGALERAVLGSVTAHVIAHAPCPVLVDRQLPQPDQ